MVSTPVFFPSPEDARRAIRAPWQDPNTWQTVGLCRRNPDTEWFPDSASAQKGLTKTCMACPVRRQCLTWALETGEHTGVWGGLTERELRKTAALTPAGTRRQRPGANLACPWCKCRELLSMVAEERVKCGRCGFDWPGLVAAEDDEKIAS